MTLPAVSTTGESTEQDRYSELCAAFNAWPGRFLLDPENRTSLERTALARAAFLVALTEVLASPEEATAWPALRFARWIDVLIDRLRAMTPATAVADPFRLPGYAPPRAVTSEIGVTGRADEYAWMEQPSAGAAALLEAERLHAEAVLHSLGPVASALASEIGSYAEASSGVFNRMETETGALISMRFNAAGQMSFWMQRDAGVPEQKFFDLAELAGVDPTVTLTDYDLSEDEKYFAYAIDHGGREVSEAHVRLVDSATDLPDVIEGAISPIFCEGDRAIAYLGRDAGSMPTRLCLHRLGRSPDTDILLYEERREGRGLAIERTDSGYLILTSATMDDSEVSVARAEAPLAWSLVAPLKENVQRFLSVGRETMALAECIDGAWQLLVAPLGVGEIQWRPLYTFRDGAEPTFVAVYREHLVVIEMVGVPRLRVVPLDGSESCQPATEGEIRLYPNKQDAADFRFLHVRPGVATVTSLDLVSGEMKEVRTIEVPGPASGITCVSEVMCGISSDGTAIPIFVLRREDISADAGNPCLLLAYGAYGTNSIPGLSSPLVEILMRLGFRVALACVRGGGEFGEPWHASGRGPHKARSFDDFEACARALIASGQTSPSRLIALGGSAGGMLVAGVANRCPSLFRAVVAEVPLADPIAELLADGAGAEIGRDEFGDPRDPAGYRTMRTWAPYENVRDQAYPSMLITVGENDPRVKPWHGLKLAARIRAHNRGSSQVVVAVWDGGHQGAVDARDPFKSPCLAFAYVMAAAGVAYPALVRPIAALSGVSKSTSEPLTPSTPHPITHPRKSAPENRDFPGASTTAIS